ncbi:unnamed protein product [Phyllotreta striolata]|uniref:Major facilitator superfamily (MFS) profile domain-containing protein n=1 Tax=Phyllotreta striolata TaxID=444603 RepID=A0A9N9TPS9_PHYSR|nr:unnamed protein product [Phyllotreta striolata]
MINKPTENKFKGTFPQILAVITGSLVALSDGMQYGWSSPALPILFSPDSPLKVTKLQGEWLETCVMVGAFCGLWLTMFLVDSIGRKRSILLAAFMSVCIWVVIAVAPRIEYVLVARALSGAVGNTAFVATPMYVAEIADQKVRGFLSSLIYLMMLVGILVIYTVMPYTTFYVHCIIGIVITVTQLIIFPFMPESPYYLIYKNKEEEAKKSLIRLRGGTKNIDKELAEIKTAIARQKEERGRIQDLFLIPSNRKAMIIMIILNSAQHFSSISVLLMNLHSILEQGGSLYMEPSTTGIVFALIMLLAASGASLFIDRFGRRSLLIFSSLATGICLMALAVFFTFKNAGYDTLSISWIPIVSVMLYALVFKVGLGLVPIVLTAELFPAKMKAYGMTLSDGVYVVAAIFSIQVYQRLNDSFGIEYPFYVFSICCYLTALFTYFIIPETKGKSLEEIQMILKGNKRLSAT